MTPEDDRARPPARPGRLLGLAGALLACVALTETAKFSPARLRAGALPPAPPNAAGWGWVALDVAVDSGGRPQGIERLHGAAPFAELVERAVAGWSFEPARDGEDAVDGHVLVVAAYRPPVLLNDAAAAAPAVAAGPTTPAPTVMTPPLYPPHVLGDAVVIVEVLVGPDGAIQERRVVQSGGGFDQAALDAAARWRFRPAHRAGAPVASYAYLAFGFRQPVVAAIRK